MSNLKPDERIKKLNILQEEAVEALKNNGYNGLLLMCTGIGKAFLILKTLVSALNDNVINEGDEVWIMAEEVKARKKTFFEDEIPKFKKLYGIDILELFNVKFYSYNIGPKYTQQIFDGEKEAPKFIAMDE